MPSPLRLSRPVRLAAGLAVGAAAVAVAAVSAAPASAQDEAPATVLLSGSFVFTSCPAGSAGGDFCLTDTLTGTVAAVGPVTGTFVVDIAFGRSDANGCAPITKSGAFTAADGSRLGVHAAGFYCSATEIADYRFTTTGGTGKFRNVRASGLWLVPPPQTSTATGGTGPEYLSPFATG